MSVIRYISDLHLSHNNMAIKRGFKKADVVEAGLEGKETEEECRWILAKHIK